MIAPHHYSTYNGIIYYVKFYIKRRKIIIDKEHLQSVYEQFQKQRLEQHQHNNLYVNNMAEYGKNHNQNEEEEDIQEKEEVIDEENFERDQNIEESKLIHNIETDVIKEEFIEINQEVKISTIIMMK